jgi:hypothetical protein
MAVDVAEVLNDDPSVIFVSDVAGNNVGVVVAMVETRVVGATVGVLGKQLYVKLLMAVEIHPS